MKQKPKIYYKITVDGKTTDIFPSSLFQNPHTYRSFLKLHGVSMTLSSPEEFTAFQALVASLKPFSSPYAYVVPQYQRLFHDGA